MDPSALAALAATHPLVKTVESGEEPTGPAAEAVRRQVESLLAIDMEDPEFLEAMDVVADLWASKGMGNTAENRRNLRSDMERAGVEKCEAFVRQMAPMRAALRQAEANAEALDRQAQASVEDLERTDAETRRVVAAHEKLLETRNRLQRQHDAAVAYRARYELSPNETAALEARGVCEERGRDADAFLAALARADAAAQDVRAALADPGAAKAGAQEDELVPEGEEGEALLAALDKATAAAYRKLFEFAAASLGRGAATVADAAEKAAASEAAATDPRHPLKRALHALHQRRALHGACRDACGASRRALCVARLKESLAERGPAGDAATAPDPARFVGDLLAWTHQALASEADVARGLFGDDGLKALVAAAVEGLASAVGDRIDAAIGRLSADAGAAHGVACVCAFYADALASKIGRGPLPEALDTAAKTAARVAVAAAQRVGEAARAVDARQDAGPAKKAMDVAEAIVRADAARPVQSAEAPAPTEAAGTVVALALDPVLASYKAQLEKETAQDFAGPAYGSGADAVGSGSGDADATVETAAWCCGVADDACRRLKALPAVTPASTAYAQRFSAFSEACAETCAREAASRLLRRCGLELMLQRCRKVELLQAKGEVLGPAADAISREALSAALRAFSSALFGDPAPDLDAIAPDGRRAEARSLCAKILAHAHASVYALAADENTGGYGETDFLVHSPEQVRVLLDV